MERSSGGGRPEVMVFRPTMDEFRDFPKYIKYMEDCGAHKVGLAKVIPPKEWIPRKSGYDNIDLMIPAPIEQQCIYGSKGTFKVFNVARKPMSVKDFETLANSPKYRTPANRGYEDLERKFWTNLTINRPIYGADISGTVTDSDQTLWNCANLGTILDRIGSVRIEGVNTAYLYFGMWKALFAWHTEDMDLYSINYLHFGATKAWYAIPPEHGRRLERLAAGLFPVDSKDCPAFLRHKMFVITPRTLREHSIPFCQAWQEKGEFMITFPYSYHAGYNLGYNCAESTNFASERWIEYGKRCSMCYCNNDMVRISMDNFVREFQPDRYDLWRAGLDVGPHPEDEFSKLYPHHAAARMARCRRQSAVVLNSRSEESKVQVSRRIPLSKPPAVETAESDSDSDSTTSATSSLSELASTGKSTPVRQDASADNSSVPRLSAAKRRRAVSAVVGLERCSSEKTVNVKKLKTQKSKQCTSSSNGAPTVKVETQATTKKKPNTSVSLACDSRTGLEQQSLPEQPFEGKMEKSLVSLEDPTSVKCSQHRSSGRITVANLPQSLSALATSPSAIVSSVSDSDVSDSGSQSLDDFIFFEDACIVESEVIETVVPQSEMKKAQTVIKSRVRKGKRTDTGQTHFRSQKSVLKVVPSLFQFSGVDFAAEMAYNCQQASQPPYCSVCSLFEANRNTNCSGIRPALTSSRPCIPEALFYHCSNQTAGMSVEIGRMPPASPLCICSRCNVCVHASCYGEQLLSLDEPSPVWTCDRCFSGSDTDACCLCELRGGALKRTVDGRWVHIVCVLALPSAAAFVDRQHRSVAINDTVFENKKSCVYCHHTGPCASCVIENCSAVFHTTCGFIADAKFTVVRSPISVVTTCPKHKQRTCQYSSDKEQQMTPITAGDHVFAKHKNGRYYRCLVLSVLDTVYYKVSFDDGTYSNDMFPEDIEVPEGCSERPLPLGSPVKVRWVDGKLYGAVFRGINHSKTVEVQFEDGSTLSAARDKVWAENEELPPAVKARMSVATETKYNLFQPEGSAVVSTRTRQVQPKYIRDDNFVSPSGKS